MKAATAVLRGAAIPVAIAMFLFVHPAIGQAQTDPAPQALPYAQDFKSLPHAATTYPPGWQGWTNGTVGAAFLTTGPTADQALVASGTAAIGTGAIYNYNGKFGPLNSGTLDFGLGLAINTSGASGVVVRYEVMTLRNPYNGGTNTRINEIALQYRVGAAGSWTTLASTGYQNGTTLQTGNTVTPQKLEYRSVTLPAACDGQPVVQLRWAQRQVSGAGARPSFAVDNVAIAEPVAGGLATGLSFDGVDDYVTFGQAPALGATSFTIETWFKRTGPGTSANTGAGGINVIPLIAKGIAENDGSTVDMNYILGIRPFAGPVIGVDYEEGAGQTTPGQNHPLWGTTVIADDVWYHAAATFDGTTLKVYLNGALESSLDLGPGRLPQSSSIQHASLGTALASNGVTPTGDVQGLFHGVLDEARIWSVAHSECEIAAGMNQELSSGAGLLGRWGMSEGDGLTVDNALGTPHGILMNGPTWVSGSPFDAVSASAPAAPTGLTASAPDGVQVQLGWTDVASNETGYVVERSTSGTSGLFVVIATLGVDATAYTDAPLAASTEYCYRVRATGDCGPSLYSGVACATTTAEPCQALSFDPDGAGTDGFVSLGNPAALQLSAMTLELWMRRDGAGAGTATGGIADLIPLIAKGRDESESETLDVNYILGIRAADGVLAADFEEAASGASPSMNHPVAGTTPIGLGTWHHVAATYDGSTWRLYLDGALEASLAVGQPLASSSTLPVALASALNSASAADGFFDGALDEVRIWNYARTQAQIQDEINTQIASAQAGLVGRWALNEAAGATAYGTAGTGIHGAIAGTPVSNWNRTACAPFNVAITHDINATAGDHGAIAPAGVTAVPHQGNQAYTITADPCFAVGDVLVDGVSVGPVTAYTFVNVRESHTIAASFVASGNTITASAGPGGAIAPSGVILVACGADQAYTISPDPCYAIADVLVDGVSVGAVSGHTFTNVQASHTIAATFSLMTFPIEASAGAGGSITPSGSTVVTCGAEQAFTIEAEACHTLADVLVDGVSVGAVGFYTFANVQAGHTIAASFTLNGPFTIEASAGVGGSITPGGSTIVACGDDQAYVISPDPCYTIADVLVDGSSIGAVASFGFANVQSNHTIAVTFTLNGPFAIEASAGAGGTIAPSGSTIVACGADQTFTIEAAPCYVIADVSVDGVSVGAVPGYTFTNLQSAHTIAATFSVTTFTIDASAGTGGTIEPSGSESYACGSDQMFTISSEPCYTIADVLVDGLSVGPSGFYTFTNLQASHTISASFVLSGPFAIDASAGPGGSITPAGTTIVACGGSQSYTIVAEDCHTITDVLIDGSSIGAVAAFTFNNVQQSHTIAVTFTATASTIIAQAIGSGTISPAGSSVVACGDDQTYTITADPGFIIVNVIVDGQGIGTDPSYTFNDVVTDHTITAVFGQTTAVEDLPREFALSRIWPNPVKDRTAIEFTVASESHVRLSVLDVTGHEVHVLAEGTFAPGRHSVAWDGRTKRGAVAPGIYFVSYVKPGGRQVRKLVMTR